MNSVNDLHTRTSPEELHRRDEKEEEEEDLWAKMQEEARFDIEQEPILSSYYHASILCHQSLEIALANHLSFKMCNSSLPSGTLIDLFVSILNENEEIMGAVKYDLRAVKGHGLRRLLPVCFQREDGVKMRGKNRQERREEEEEEVENGEERRSNR
ncbi:hypothetical protein QN277_000288 [Acacia crassicarpa]|uniref:Serine acetyltransferase N-terminal domain-containing protein n=1 Tax=Acacia crassicarpa TaxID=499986 RepID=A0AAE1N5Z5_9FABA|nr:hypothetical protein QN277_000288 [Acacia crassicarpa]